MDTYEKKYNEALERASHIKDNNTVATPQEVAEHIFPELRESEDERTRKKLVRFISEIKEIAESGRGSWAVRKEDAEMCAAFLEYLEKQKESLHIHETCEETAVSLTGEDEGIVNWLYDMLKSGLENAPKDCPYNPIAEKALAWLEKQKEQKPEIKYVYPKFRKGDVIEPIIPNGHFTPVRVVNIWDGSYSCRSDDDKAHLSLPIRNEDEYRLVEHKPAEWNEEDERIRQGLIEMYKNEHLVSVPIGVHAKDIIRFLENLRPSWKPSEEQMRGLKFFLDFHRSQRNAGTTNWREYDSVESLYEQLLKKL